VRIHASAFKHGQTNDDIEHAWTNALGFFDIYPESEPVKSLCIGADLAGNLLELLYLQLDEVDLIIHAMPLRTVFAQYLLGDES